MKWECHEGMDSTGIAGLKDTDLTAKPFGLPSASIDTCESVCSGTKECVVINWHESDKHCHVLTGVAPTTKVYEKALKKSATATSCRLVKK